MSFLDTLNESTSIFFSFTYIGPSGADPRVPTNQSVWSVLISAGLLFITKARCKAGRQAGRQAFSSTDTHMHIVGTENSSKCCLLAWR